MKKHLAAGVYLVAGFQAAGAIESGQGQGGDGDGLDSDAADDGAVAIEGAVARASLDQTRGRHHGVQAAQREGGVLQVELLIKKEQGASAGREPDLVVTS
jgi:hypothetical protein